ncbi:MAG: class I SAM-dependent methyltransferase [Lachnospiraceae bacterium]|nr:class I SAM-dependent methyltransferase [Lachnospiraceae bacterium]
MITFNWNSIILELETSDKVFSPSGIDRGTLAMLRQVTFLPEDHVLDLGCGYGPVGILAARQIGQENVTMSDISPEAVALSRRNAVRNGVPDIQILESNGFENLPEGPYTLILSNPPYHTDFSVAKHFIETSYKVLSPGGRLYMVTKRRDWYKNKLIATFGGVTITEDDGYYIFCSEKRPKKPHSKKPAAPNHLSRKLSRRHSST